MDVCVEACARLGGSPQLSPDAFTALTSSCTPFLTHPPVAIAYCRAVADACARDDAHRIAAGEDVMRHVLTCIAAACDPLHTQDDPALVEQWCRAVRWLAGGKAVASQHTRNIGVFLEGGGVPLLLDAMRTHVACVGVQVCGRP